MKRRFLSDVRGTSSAEYALVLGMLGSAVALGNVALNTAVGAAMQDQTAAISATGDYAIDTSSSGGGAGNGNGNGGATPTPTPTPTATPTPTPTPTATTPGNGNGGGNGGGNGKNK